MEEGSDYYVVRKGDTVAVYGALGGCQTQISSSVSGPAASAYKGYSWNKEKEKYFSSHGLSNAAYVINAAELTEDILGPLVPFSFEDIINSSSNQPTPNHMGFHDGTRNQAGFQSVDLNQGIQSGSTRNLAPHNSNHSGAVDVLPVSKQYRKEETTFHVLFACPFSQQCWSSLGYNWDWSLQFHELMVHMRQACSHPFFMEIFTLAAWTIWKQLNNFIFDRGRPSFLLWKNSFLEEAALQAQRIQPDSWADFLSCLEFLSP